MTHSPEPWKIDVSHDHPISIVDADGMGVLPGDGWYDSQNQKHIKEVREVYTRIVACTNLLAGVPTETLEAMLAEGIRPVLNRTSEYSKHGLFVLGILIKMLIKLSLGPIEDLKNAGFTGIESLGESFDWNEFEKINEETMSCLKNRYEKRMQPILKEEVQ